MKTRNLGSMIRESARLYPDKIAMRSKVDGEWQSTTYREMNDTVSAIAKALLDQGIQPGDTVGIFSPNCPNWTVADLAILSVGAVSVAIYATDTAKAAEYLAHDAGLRLIFVGGQEHYDKVKSFIGAQELLETVVVFDEAVVVEDKFATNFADFMERGRRSENDGELDARLSAVQPDDLALLIYTSGTTGLPKGVMLTHANFFHQFAALDERFVVGQSDRSLCFLPLSHAYERCWTFYVVNCGAQNNYISDPKKVVEYLSDVKPTVMVSVPLLYEKIYAGVQVKLAAASSFRLKLFQWSLEVGKQYYHEQYAGEKPGAMLTAKHVMADFLALSRIRDLVGGPKNFFSAGGAPLPREIEEFFFSVGLLVCQGYGLTEAAPMVTCNSPGAFKFGTVGMPVLGVEIRIGDEAEILVRGANVTTGYYNRPEDTKKLFVDGWLKTGDIGEIDGDGYVRITDRLKDLIITQGGENVAPQHIETALKLDPYIEQVVVLGDKRKFLTAIVVPEFIALQEYARTHEIPFDTQADLVGRAEIREFYLENIRKYSIELAPYEQIREFIILEHSLSQDNDELTPTQKVKRKVIVARYADRIDEMYRV